MPLHRSIPCLNFTVDDVLAPQQAMSLHRSRACSGAPLPSLFLYHSILQALAGVSASKTIVSAEDCAALAWRSMLHRHSTLWCIVGSMTHHAAPGHSLVHTFWCTAQQQSILQHGSMAPQLTTSPSSKQERQ